MEFHAYRSLCGLLEHLRAVVLKGRHVMHGLYRPHGPDGAARFGPNGVIDVDELMRKQLLRWLELLAQAGGVSAKRALLREDLDPPIEWHIDASSDACLADVQRAGIGGYCHGLYWYVEVPEEDRPLFAIPTLEFLGVAFNILFLHATLMPSLTESRGAVMVNLRTDALTSSLHPARRKHEQPSTRRCLPSPQQHRGLARAFSLPPQSPTPSTTLTPGPTMSPVPSGESSTDSASS